MSAASNNGTGVASATPTPGLYTALRNLGRTLDDIERVRIQGSNRISAIARSLGAEGAISRESIPVELLAPFDALDKADAVAVETLENLWRQHPLAAWAKGIRGVGDKTIARLIAEVGDPLIRQVGHVENEGTERRKFVVDGWEPRTLAQLQAYCGHGDPARRKRRGMSQDDAFECGNPIAKKRLWLIASSGIKSRCPACRAASKEREEGDVAYLAPASGCTCDETHPLRHAYDTARAKYATRIHADGALLGQPWTPGHQHAAALRYVGKVFLRMLYDAATEVAREREKVAA